MEIVKAIRPARKIAVYRTGDVVRVEVEGAGRRDIPDVYKRQATDKIALRSDALCRKYREITPPVDEWCWNLTPWTCDASHSYGVRGVSSSGAMYWGIAYYGSRGVRPLCYPKSVILVSIPGEDDEEEQAARREEMKLEAVDALMSTLNDYPPYLLSLIHISSRARRTAGPERARRCNRGGGPNHVAKRSGRR